LQEAVEAEVRMVGAVEAEDINITLLLLFLLEI
jgi:hypothetical protein